MKRCNKSSLFFGSIMAVFLHQIHLKIKKREMKIPLISLNKKKMMKIYTKHVIDKKKINKKNLKTKT